MWFLGPRSARIGHRGERVAARALRRRGYRILARRWRTPVGEIDLLCVDRGVVVVVEVKARGGPGPLPADRIDHAKRIRLRAACRYVGRLDTFRGHRTRIDVVLVRLGRNAALVVQQDVLRFD